MEHYTALVSRSEKSSSDFQTLTQRRGESSSLLCGELWSFDDAFLDSWEIKIKELFNWNLIFFSLISLTKVWIFIVKNVKLNNVLLYSSWSWIKRCMTLTQSTNMWENFWKLSIVYYFCCLLSLYCHIWALGRIFQVISMLPIRWVAIKLSVPHKSRATGDWWHK